jgi:hypothetical protein
MAHRRLAPRLCFLAAALLCLACGEDASTSREPSARVAIEVRPLTLTGIADASYTISVVNDDDEPVWATTITSVQFGDGAGSLSYVGACDASSSPNTVSLVLESLSDAGGPIPVDEYVNPTVPVPLTQSVDCVENADTLVVFNIAIIRDANQGFFDIAINFDDIFCSAKVDCRDADGDPLLFLHDPGTGERAGSMIIALACTAGIAQDTHLYMSDVTISCDDDISYVLDPSEGPGNIGALPPLVFQHATYIGTESLSGDVHKS